jgi:hypothetical protein
MCGVKSVCMRQPSSAGRLNGLLVFAIALVSASLRPSAVQVGRVSEYELKANFIYTLFGYVRWPQNVFRTPADPLRLVIIGDDPFNGVLDRLLANKRVDERPIVVVHAASDVTAPVGNMAFIAASEEKRLAKVLAAYCHAPVLTVSDIANFAARGGVIGLVMEGQDVRFALNRTAADEARLGISGQVFHLALPLFSAISPCR